MSLEPAKEDLLRELQCDAESSLAEGRINNITDLVLMYLSVIASILAVALAATVSKDGTPAWLAAIFAGLPAACTSLRYLANFHGRSTWYFEHAARIRALSNSLKYASNPDLAKFANDRNAVEISMAEKWREVVATATPSNLPTPKGPS